MKATHCGVLELMARIMLRAVVGARLGIDMVRRLPPRVAALLERAVGAAEKLLQKLRRSPRIWKMGLGVAAAAALSLTVLFGPLVKSRARAAAEARGVEIEVGSVRAGWGRVWLRDVTARPMGANGIEARLDAVAVDLSLGLRVEALDVHGGVVKLRGTEEELERQLDEWRGRRGEARAGDSAGGRTAYSARGIHVVWHESGSDATPRLAWGIRYARDTDGRERIGVDRAQMAWRDGALELRTAEASLRREGERRVVERVQAEALSATLGLDRLLEGAATTEAGRSAAVEPGKQSAAERKAADPRAKAAAPGRAAASENRGAGVLTLHASAAERGPKLRRAFSRLASMIESGLPVEGELDLSGVSLKLRRGKEELNAGPGRVRVRRGTDRAALSFVPGQGAEHALTLRAEVPLKSGPVQVELDGGPVSLGTLGVKEGDFGLLDVAQANVAAKGKLLFTEDGKLAAFNGSGTLSGVSINHKALASRPVRGIRLSWRGRGEAALDGSRVRLDQGELEFGGVRIQAHGEIERGAEDGRIAGQVTVPLASCQAVLDALPEGLAPLLTGMRMSGTFALDASLQLDTKRLDHMRFGWNLANECRITATPADIAPRRFSAPWVREVRGADGRTVQIDSGPGTPGWVPFGAISPNVETAVMICEDGRFHRHDGFDQEAIRNSFRENVRSGRFVRGASTISMQLSKNLYLTREKTLSRKLQEAVLTLLLEQELSKQEILELYLNVIELGPGIYGIGPAAQHYFNTSASRLSLGQALYLASILPNPKQQHFGAGGEVTPGWSNYLRKLMHIAVKIKRISEQELEDALREQVTFGVPYSPRDSGDGDVHGESIDDAHFRPPAPGPTEETSYSSP
jgi:monofunctional biosynthetic peptidoglycan transglycosylase